MTPISTLSLNGQMFIKNGSWSSDMIPTWIFITHETLTQSIQNNSIIINDDVFKYNSRDNTFVRYDANMTYMYMVSISFLDDGARVQVGTYMYCRSTLPQVRRNNDGRVKYINKTIYSSIMDPDNSFCLRIDPVEECYYYVNSKTGELYAEAGHIPFKKR